MLKINPRSGLIDRKTFVIVTSKVPPRLAAAAAMRITVAPDGEVRQAEAVADPHSAADGGAAPPPLGSAAKSEADVAELAIKSTAPITDDEIAAATERAKRSEERAVGDDAPRTPSSPLATKLEMVEKLKNKVGTVALEDQASPPSHTHTHTPSTKEIG